MTPGEPQGPTPDDDRVAARSDLLPEEQVAGSDDPAGQADVILDESDQRSLDREAAPDAIVEHRTSDETVEPPG